MSVRKRNGAWQVEVNDSSALDGYRRIRRQVPDELKAIQLEAEIAEALRVYGKWPVPVGEEPRDTRKPKQHGNLRLSAQIALETHWRGMPAERVVRGSIWPVIEFFEQSRRTPDIGDITSEDLDALIEWEKVKGNSGDTINHHLSYLRTINRVANEREITAAKMPIKRIRPSKRNRWVLTPEDEERVIRWLRESQRDDIFADVIEVMVGQGLNTLETLALEAKHFQGLEGDDPSISVPNPKTGRAAAPQHLSPSILRVIKGAIHRGRANRWRYLFPLNRRQVSHRWEAVRVYLGVADEPGATLRALSFTYSHRAGLPHVPTTPRYPEPVEGGQRDVREVEVGALEEATQPALSRDLLAAVLGACRDTGVTPKQIGAIVRAMQSACG